MAEKQFKPINGANYKHDYNRIFADIAAKVIPRLPTYRELAKNDLFFLLYFGVGRTDINHKWIIERIREVEDLHYDTLDLWAREHYKSTILTYGLILQEIINNPNERICIFSHTRPIAKGFLRQIKHTIESTPPLVRWFHDVFWEKPKRDAPKWSEDDGLVLKRSINTKEATIEAWGLVDGQPTSRHYTIRVYDDVVTREGVTSPDVMRKTREAYELSQSLGTVDGRKRVIGTRYHFADLYSTLKASGNYHVREYPATHDGTPSGVPVLLTRRRLNELRREQGPYVFSCQQLLSPMVDEGRKFRSEWVRHYTTLPQDRNKYIFVDPAHSRRSSDYTVMALISVDQLGNRYLEKLIRKRMNLSDRWKELRDLVLEVGGGVPVYYERYGMQADCQYIEQMMGIEGVYFPLSEIGGIVAKAERIERLVPVFERGQFLLPHVAQYHEGEDIIKVFIEEELLLWPYSKHDDMLDCVSRIEDPAVGARGPIGRGYGYLDMIRERTKEIWQNLEI